MPRRATSRIGTIGQRPVKTAPAPLRVLPRCKSSECGHLQTPTAGLSTLILALTDGAVMEPGVATGGNQRQIRWLSEPQKQANSVATACRQLRREVHGKQGVCRGLPPVAEGPLPAKEEVEPLKRQVLRTRRPTGLDRATLTRERWLVKPNRALPSTTVGAMLGAPGTYPRPVQRRRSPV